MTAYQNVAIIGVGLIGGSIGLALRERRLADRVIGVGRRQSSLDKALKCGVIHTATTDLSEGVSAAEVVVVATPVGSVIADVCRVLAAAPQAALVTDVGSTKAEICTGVAAEADNCGSFVGSHPLAGDHRTGPENARADLLQDKVVVVTPTSETPEATTRKSHEFWRRLGAEVVEMSPLEHDRALATTSHLPHLLASAMAAITPPEWLPLSATGWADTTRVAAGDPGLWTQIFSQNSQQVVESLDKLIEQLQSARHSLVNDDQAQLEHFLLDAKRIRDALGN